MDATQSVDEYYRNIEDCQSLVFTKELLNEIVLYEKTVELIGIIDKVEMKNTNLLKFTITNKNNDIVQILAWGEVIINSIENMITSGNIIHIDGAFAKFKDESKSRSTCIFYLTISSNTVVRLLKTSPGYIRNDSSLVETTIADSIKFKETIVVEGYIRNVIRETSLPSSTINQGSISDCTAYKLQVRMPITCNMSRFEIGVHVKVKGTIKYADCPYIWVEREGDITVASDEKKSLAEVLKGFRNPKRVLSDLNESIERRKFKAEK